MKSHCEISLWDLGPLQFPICLTGFYYEESLIFGMENLSCQWPHRQLVCLAENLTTRKFFKSKTSAFWQSLALSCSEELHDLLGYQSQFLHFFWGFSSFFSTPSLLKQLTKWPGQIKGRWWENAMSNPGTGRCGFLGASIKLNLPVNTVKTPDQSSKCW